MFASKARFYGRPSRADGLSDLWSIDPAEPLHPRSSHSAVERR